MSVQNGIQLIVGLGNPGQKYENDRHNAGVWFTDQLGSLYNAHFKQESKFRGAISKITTPQGGCWLLKPNTYMNESGQSIRACAQFYNIDPENILIAHDELDLPPGSCRLKHDGGHGGHNGLRDAINHLHSKSFTRLRIGIGHPGNKNDVADYVLKRPSIAEKKQIITAIDQSIPVIDDLIAGKLQQAFHALHSD